MSRKRTDYDATPRSPNVMRWTCTRCGWSSEPFDEVETQPGIDAVASCGSCSSACLLQHGALSDAEDLDQGAPYIWERF